MITIRARGYVRSSWAVHLVMLTATGNTPTEVRASLDEQMRECRIERVEVVGLDNNIADWIMMYGPERATQDYSFRDSPATRTS